MTEPTPPIRGKHHTHEDLAAAAAQQETASAGVNPVGAEPAQEATTAPASENVTTRTAADGRTARSATDARDAAESPNTTPAQHVTSAPSATQESPARDDAATHPRHAAHSTTPGAPVDDTAATTTHPDGAHTAPEAPKKKQPPLVAFIIGLPIVLGLMLLAFASPAVHSGAKDLPLAVSGPQQATSQIVDELNKNKPGAFDVKTYATPKQGADAIKNRDAIGGIAVGKDGAVIQTAAGAGSPYSPILKGIGANLAPQLAKQGQKVTYQELAPLPAKDPLGTVMTSAALPLIFGGMATAAALFFTFRGSFGRRALGVLGVATLGGLLASLILTHWLSAVDCSYWKLSLAFDLGIAAISFTVLGLAKNLGAIGFGLGAITMLFISNPISGTATGPQWLPHPWGTIGQYLPVGAAGTVLRSVAYFGGRGATHAWIVLACWALGGFVLLAMGKARKTVH